MYLKRKADAFLQEWKDSPAHLPLIIRGPRQVGKTETIRHFCQTNYKNIVEINFVEKPQFKRVVDEGFGADSIIRLISRMDPSLHFEPSETLIFFDEIQEFPEITTSLKFFKTDGRFDVICSGSLLGIQRSRIESHSVGYKTDYFMRSFDFEEFLWAVGYPDDLVDDMLGHMLKVKAFSRAELDKYFSLFMDYILLGGMPAVLSRYVERKTFEGSLDIQKQLLLDYQEDIQKYAEGLDQSRILSVFNSIPPQLAKADVTCQLSDLPRHGLTY